ncbi:MAG TPA: helix-turn-helix transcriptional regulator [Puia sp.]
MEKIPVRHIKEPRGSENFNIRTVQALVAGGDVLQELHRHDFYYILILERGAGEHEIDFQSYGVVDYSVFFMRPGQVHRLLLKAGSTGYLMQFREGFYFPTDRASRLMVRKAGNVTHYRFDADGFQKILALLTYIFQEYVSRQEGYQEVIKANLGIFFIEMVRQYSGSLSDHAGLYTQERLGDFLELLETQAFVHKEVSYYAGALNLSTYQLNAITKAALGKTSSAVINEYIILEAKRQLLATSSLVSQIADRLGYEDVSYFIRFFRHHTGYSPEAFRQNFR